MTNEELCSYTVKRYDKLYGDQGNWRTTWQEEADYIMPRKSGNIQGQTSPGSKLTGRLMDSTAIHSNEMLAASMNGALTSSSVRWFSLKVRNIDESQDKEVIDWLEDCSNRMYRAIQQSNFNSEIHECYLDLGAFGTAALEITERKFHTVGFNGLHFKAYSIGEYVIDEDADGRVNTIMRKFKLSAKAAYDEWGEDAGEDVVNKYKTNPDDDVEILHVIMPAKDAGLPGRIHKFASLWINYGKKIMIAKKGFREWPVPAPRWSKASGEKYGRGPGHTALPDIKTLNKATELNLKAWAKAIDPPLSVLHDGVIGSVRLQPSGLTYVREHDAIRPIEFNSKFNVSEVKEEDLKTSIRRIFFSDQLQFQETPQMTATEVYVRYELMQRLLGPTLGRLESELMNPTIERIFSLMLRAGAFLPMPEVLKKYDSIDIEYEGPMARAMRASEVVAIQRTFQVVAPLAQVKPEILDWFDVDKIAKYAPGITGMPSSLLRDETAVAQIRKQREEEMAKQQQKQDLRDLAEGAGKVAPLLDSIGNMAGIGEGAKNE